MSADGDMTAPHELVIVRRRGGDGDEGHHGGAWKIAFADLMTAMMAFFLVMWLVNVSDKEKIEQIATYFNPMKLNSKAPTEKGVDDKKEVLKPAVQTPTGDKGVGVSIVDEKAKRKANAKPGGNGELTEGVEKQADEELFNDPYGVLARLAAKAETVGEQSNVAKSENNLPSGEAFNNPFEPFVDQNSPHPRSEQNDHEQMTLVEPGLYPQPPAIEKPLEVKPDPTNETPPAATVHVQPVDPALKQDAGAGAADAQSQEKIDQQVKQLEGELATVLEAISPDRKPNIEVKRVSEGVLISLTDDFRFGMFATSSAEPSPELVVVMEKVAKVLTAHEGNIVVRGHTDARPFRTERNNNWRLSSARAQMAYYMLARGGVEERRFESIEGRADRSLRIPADPNAAENRRIEIMLRPKP
jgi:chemotaxis protein MotB